MVRAVVLHGVRRVLVELEIRPGNGVRGRINRAPVPRSRDLLGAVRAVVFAPEDLALVRGDPEERRRFLDTLALQRLPRYLAIRQDFDRILRQRNTLLRSAMGRTPAGGGQATLEVWDRRLADAGAEVWSERLRIVEALRPLVAEAYQTVAGRPEQVDLAYVASVGEDLAPGTAVPTLAEVLRERLVRDRTRELERGVTLTGPHRDDLALHLAELPARSHSSQGEAWSLALGLRLGSYRWLAGEGETPLLLLDDVFAELDRDRRRRLAEAAVEVEQVIATAAVPEDVPEELRSTKFEVRPGAVRRLSAPASPSDLEVEVSRETWR